MIELCRDIVRHPAYTSYTVGASMYSFSLGGFSLDREHIVLWSCACTAIPRNFFASTVYAGVVKKRVANAFRYASL